MSNLNIGPKLMADAQAQMNALREVLKSNMEAAGYVYMAGGYYDCEWAVWVHKDYVELAHRHTYEDCLMTGMMAEELGVTELPKGAVIDAVLY